EARRQFGERLYRGLANTLVAVNHDLLALAVLERDGNDLLGQPALFLGVLRGLLAAQGVGIHLLARDAILLRQVLRGNGHATADVAIGQRLPEVVFQLV